MVVVADIRRVVSGEWGSHFRWGPCRAVFGGRAVAVRGVGVGFLQPGRRTPHATPAGAEPAEAFDEQDDVGRKGARELHLFPGDRVDEAEIGRVERHPRGLRAIE